MNAYPNQKALILYILLSFIWGGSFILIHFGLECLTPLELSALRIGTGAIVLSPIVLLQFKKASKSDWLWLGFSGILGSLIPSTLYATAQQAVSSSMAGILSSFTPFFTIGIASIFFANKITKKQFLGICLGFFAGLALIVFQSGLTVTPHWQALLILLATLCYAINLNILKFKLKHIPPLVIASGTLVLPGVLSLIYLTSSTHFANILTCDSCTKSIWSIIGLGCTATALAIVLFNYLLKISTPAFASSITYVIPIIAMILGYFLVGEKIGFAQIGATLVILYSVRLIKN